MSVRRTLALCAAAVALGASQAAGISVNCNVNASGGYANCLSFSAPSQEAVQAYHTAGLPYRFQLHRPATSTLWGWWQYNDRAVHVIALSLSGTIVAQVDNMGSANPAAYWVAME